MKLASKSMYQGGLLTMLMLFVHGLLLLLLKVIELEYLVLLLHRSRKYIHLKMQESIVSIEDNKQIKLY